jgi:hypothetical protein
VWALAREVQSDPEQVPAQVRFPAMEPGASLALASSADEHPDAYQG